ncbi:hypothetical protein K438DRAFT_1933298 [Mycena galopus ATCC 62051]|nr:hypothetical protein K438DRAFT_1933298 [Mycena galopus ATCC 62051]
MIMKFPLFTTIASLALATAQNTSSGGLTSQQLCLENCSLAAVNASGCNIQNTACVCASSVYATNVTQCATSTCNFTASDINGFLTSGCANVSGFTVSNFATPSNTGSGGASPTSSSVPNTAEFSATHVGLAAASVFGLVFSAFLV